MADNAALLAAMKLRQQQKAEEDAARAHAEEMARQSVTDQTMSPWATMGQGAMDWASDYANKVGEAAAPQIERAKQGFLDLVGSSPVKTSMGPIADIAMGAGNKIARGQGADAANKLMDTGFGALNTAFSPLAPPMEAVLKPALESETGQGFVQDLDALGTGIEDATGISKQNQLDAAMWLGAPVAGHYAGKGFRGMAKKLVGEKPPVPTGAIAEADPAIHAPDMQSGDAFADMNSRIEGLGKELSGPSVDDMVKYYSDRGAEHVAKYADLYPKLDDVVGTKTLAPNKAGLDAYFAAQKRFERQKALNEIDRKNGGNTDLTNVEPLLRNGEPRGQAQSVEARIPTKTSAMDETFDNYADNPNGFDESGRPKTGADVAQAYRSWAKREGATIDDAWSMLEDEKSAWPKDVYDEASIILHKEASGPGPYDQSRTPLYNQISAKQKAKLDPLAELDGGDVSPRMTPQSAREDYASSGTAWTTPRKDGAGFPIKDEPRGQAQSVEAKAPGPAAISVGVKPGQSLWDIFNERQARFSDNQNPTRRAKKKQPAAKTFQAGDDVLRNAAVKEGSVPRRVTIMPEGMMDGKKSGVRNVEIVTSPDVRDFQKAAKGNIYDEARFLVEDDGVVHTWPAEAGWHDDIARYLGITRDKYHGVVRKSEIDAAVANGAKTMQDVIEFTQNPAWWGPFKEEYGLKNLPEWQASEKALAESYSPKQAAQAATEGKAADWYNKTPEEQSAESVKFDSPLAELDNAPPKLWKDRRADKATAALDDQRNQSMPRKKGEAVFEPTRGYTERQAKLNSPLAELDNPDQMSSEIAAARARADETFAYKKDQPAATKPEAVPEIKAQTRKVWLDPDRPIIKPEEVPKQLSEIAKGGFKKLVDEAKTKVGKAFVAAREKAFPKNADERITTSSLAEKTNRALEEHIAMTPEQRAVNYAAAKEALRPYIGSKDGQNIFNFLGANAKLRKNSEGYLGGEPITLPNGQGIESTGLTLAAYFEKKGFNTCPRGQPCKDACLSETSGANLRYESPGIFQKKKTNAILDVPEASAVALFENILEARAKARRNGNVLTVRLNVLSDLDPKVWAPIIKHFDDVLFVDYTKMKYEPLAPNQHFTYSSTGASNEHTTSLYANWDQSKARLDRGDNVAMAFSTKKTWPKWVVDEETGKRYRVVDGVSHDFRVVDLQDANKEGVIVGLKNMDEKSRDMSFNKTGHAIGDSKKVPMTWEDDASTTSGGFMVRYDPAKDGDTAYIPIQNSAKRSRLERNKTGPQTAIKVGGEDRTPAQNREALMLEDFDTPGPFAQPKKRNPPSAYSKLDRKRKAEAKKKQDQDVDDVAQRMYARLHMQDHAPKFDKNQPRKLWEEEYPKGYQSALNHDDLWPRGKRVEVDIDGDPIHPDALIFGRTEVGGTDKNQAPRKIREMAEKIMQAKNPKAKIEKTFQPNSRTGGVFRFSKGMKTGDTYPEGITINTATPEWLQDQTLAHETMHGIDFLGGNTSKNVEHLNARTGAKSVKLDAQSMHSRTDVPIEARDELFSIYEEVNENFGRNPSGFPNEPERNGYPKHMTQAELIAEAGRLYMMDPGYIKAKFPHAAAYLRKIVKESPDVSKHVHFNEVGGGLAGVMAAKYLADQQQGNR